MKIEGIKTTTEKVKIEVNKEKVLDTLIKEFKNTIKVNETDYVKSGVWVSDVEYGGGSHSWYETIVTRAATKEEIKVLEAFYTIQNFFKKD